MEPREFLRRLMALRGHNATSLSKEMRGATSQPQIYRFLTGEAMEPRRSTLQPIADFYRVDIEALYDPQRATEEWARLTGEAAPSHPTEGLQAPEIPSVPLSDDVLLLFSRASHDEIELAEDVLRQILGRSSRSKRPADKSVLKKHNQEMPGGDVGEDHDARGRAHGRRA